MAQWAKVPTAMSALNTGSSSSCSDSCPAPCWLPRKATDDGLVTGEPRVSLVGSRVPGA